MYNKHELNTFKGALLNACVIQPLIQEMCSSPNALANSKGYQCYLSTDLKSGFVIHSNGELTHVFSAVPRRGTGLIRTAVTLGANKLDCFDGYLVQLYTGLGFKEIKRESNWDSTGPDVVYMGL